MYAPSKQEQSSVEVTSNQLHLESFRHGGKCL